MPDFLSGFERALKAIRFGLFSASDQLALAVGGLCRTPEPPGEPVVQTFTTDHQMVSIPLIAGCNGKCGANCICDKYSAADSPAVVAAPGPEDQESGSPPRDSANPPAPSAGTPTCPTCGRS